MNIETTKKSLSLLDALQATIDHIDTPREKRDNAWHAQGDLIYRQARDAISAAKAREAAARNDGADLDKAIACLRAVSPQSVIAERLQSMRERYTADLSTSAPQLPANLYPNEDVMCEAAYTRACLTNKAAADALRPAFRAILESALTARHGRQKPIATVQRVVGVARNEPRGFALFWQDEKGEWPCPQREMALYEHPTVLCLPISVLLVAFEEEREQWSTLEGTDYHQGAVRGVDEMLKRLRSKLAAGQQHLLTWSEP